MNAKTLLTAAALAIFPALAMACPSHDTASMSCKEGYTFDADSSTCVETKDVGA